MPLQRMSKMMMPEMEECEGNPLEMLRDMSLLKLMLAYLSKNDPYEKEIVDRLLRGESLDRGHLQHILDEASQVSLPESYNAAMDSLAERIKVTKL